MPHLPCAHEFCDRDHDHETAVPSTAMCRCTICKRAPLHHPVCCGDHFRAQHRRPGACEPMLERRRRFFGRAR